MHRVRNAAVWTVLCVVLVGAGCKGREAYRDYRAVTDAVDTLDTACEESGPQCLKPDGIDKRMAAALLRIAT